MFSEKKSTSKTTTLNINRISNGTSLVGNIESDSDFRIDGEIEGSIKTSNRIIIGKEGKVKGDIHCSNADIEGAFSGKLIATNTLTLKATAKINGDVVIGKLSVEPGASFNATCNMKTGVKDLKENGNSTKAEKIA